MPIIRVEGVGKIKLPDEWDEAQIGAFVAKEFGGEDEVADPETSWFLGRFAEAWGESYEAAEDGLAIGKLVISNDKPFAIDLLEGEFNQWQNSTEEGGDPPAFFAWASAGEIVGGVTRDLAVGAGIGRAAAPCTTPIGGVIAGAAAVTSLQSLTAKGASFKDAYIQIRAKQLERGIDDKDAAYETARKISNADAAYAAAETVVSTAVPGFGKVGTRAITKGVGKVGGRVMSRGAVDVTGKAISELGLDMAAGGVGSIASDVTAEAIGEEQGVNRYDTAGELWQNAAKAAAAEGLVGLPTTAIRTQAHRKEFKRREEFIDDALERGRQYQSDQQEITAQTDIIVQRGLEQEREQARRLKEGQIPPAERAKRGTQAAAVVIEGKPIDVEGRLVLPPDARNVPPPGMGIPVDEGVMATGEGVSPILDRNGNVLLYSPTVIDPVTRVEAPTTLQTELGTHLDAGTEARAMQAQRARAGAAFLRMGHGGLGDALGWVDNRIRQLVAMQERGAKDPKAEFPIEEGQLEFQFGWPEGGPTLDQLGFDKDVGRVLNPNLDLTTPSPGLNISDEIARLSDLRGRFEARQAEIKFAEKEAEVTGVKVTDHRKPSIAPVPLDIKLDIPKKEAAPIKVAKPEVVNLREEADAPPPPLETETFEVTQEAADFYNEGATETTISSPDGRIKIASGVDNSPNKNSVVDFVVPEGKRGQGHGKALMAKAVEMFPELGGQVSSLAALKIAYDAGRRPPTKPDATWEQTKNTFEEASPKTGGSINMKTPEGTSAPSKVKPEKQKARVEARVEAHKQNIARRRVLRNKLKTFAKKGGLTKKEGKQFTALVDEHDALLYDHRKNVGTDTGKVEDVKEPSETKSTLSPEVVAQAHTDAHKSKKVFLEVSQLTAGTFHDADTGVDTILKNEDPEISAQEFYDTFSETREKLRKQYGDTIPLYRIETGKQKEKPTKLWATTKEFVEEIGKQEGYEGGKIIQENVPVEQIASVNVRKDGTYHELVVADKKHLPPRTTPKPTGEANAVATNQQKAQEAKNEIKAALKDISDPTKMSMGVDPTPIWKAFKGLVKLAYYHGARGAKSAAEFAKRAGLNLTAAVKKAWDVYKSKRAIRPKDMGARVTADLYGSDRTLTAEGQARKAARDRIEIILHPKMGSAGVRVLADKFIGLDHLQKLHAAGKAIPDTNNGYQAQQLMDGILGANHTKFGEEIDGIMQQMEEMQLPFEDVEAYLYALHAKERNDHIAKINKKFPDGGSGMTEADRVEVLKRIRDSGKQEQYDKIVSQIYAITKRTLQVQLEGGLITQQDFDALSNYYKNYVPLKGHHDSDPFSQQSGNHIPITGEIKGRDNEYALGHGERSQDILAYVFEQHDTAVARAERNKVYQTIRNWVEANPDNEVIELATTENAPLEPKRTPAKMEKVDGVDYIVEEATVKDVKQSGWQNNSDIVALRVNGENVYLRVKHEALAKNLKEMGTATLGEFTKMVAGFMRWRALTNTMLNVDFPLSNFTRDLFTAGINLGAEENAVALQKATMKNVMPAFRAIWKTERGKTEDSEMVRAFKLMRKHGGKMEFSSLHNLENNIRKIEEYDALLNPDKYSITEAVFSKDARGLTKAQNVAKAARLRLRSKARFVTERKLVKGAFNILKDANAAMENATRLAVFKAVMDTGKATPQQAAFMARNITVNFTKKGELGTALNAAYLFYNANIGGNLRILQAAKSPRVQKILMAGMAAGAFENLFNQMVGEEDEDGFTDYDKIPEYVKESNIIIPMDWIGELFGIHAGKKLKDKDGNFLDGKFITVMLPYGYNTVYYAGRQITSTIPALGGKKKVGTAIGDTLHAAINSFNPIGGSRNLLRSLTPEIGKPIVDIATNTDWKGDRIMPDRNPFEKYEIPMSERKWSTAAAWSTNLTRELNSLAGGSRETSSVADFSPEHLDYAVQFLTGGMGQSISRVIDAPFKLAEGRLRMEDIPIIRRFQEDPSPYFEMQNHKELRQTVYSTEATLKRMRKEKAGPRAIKDFKEDNAIALKMLGRVKAIDSTLRELNSATKNVQASSKFNRAEKKKKLEGLNGKKQKLLRETQKKFVDLVNEE